MTESDWLESDDPDAMLNFLTAAASDRKLRLFACACCRLLWEELPEGACRRAVEVSERFADELASREELQRSWAAAARSTAGVEARISGWSHLTAAEAEARDSARSGAWAAAHGVVRDAPAELREQHSALLHDIFHPFHPVAIDPRWLAPSTVALAQTIYQEKSFDRLPELAAALQAAGCTDATILDHLRRPGPHARGCFVIDALLGKG